MKRNQPRTMRSLSLGLLGLGTSAALLVACGGGDGGIGSGGTGQSPTEGYAVGTVDGFGSIFVGGVRCDDARARVSYQTAAGTAETGSPEIRLGQRVQIAYDASGGGCKLTQAQVDPELVGRISSLSPLTVAGQRVLIVSDASIAPPTVFEGHADAAALRIGDRVEVHGDLVGVGAGAAVQASRIERKPLSDTWVRARGVVSGLSATQFTIGGLTVKRDAGTRLDPAALTLADGQTVTVWSSAAVAGDGSVNAQVIKLSQRSLGDQQLVRIEGVVAGCAASPCTQPTLDGLGVDLAGASFINGSLADVADGVALRVEGRWDAARSRLAATRASVRARDVTAGAVRLIGLVSDFVSASDFSVRGMAVTTDAGTRYGSGCTLTGNGQIVGIQGRVSAAQVLATQVDCLTVADISTVDVFGAVVAVDLAARSFTVSEGLFRSYTFVWDADTVFGAGLTPESLRAGLRFGLRAALVDGKLLVKRMIADPTPVNIPAGVQVFGNFGIAQDVTAGSLTVRRIQMGIVPATVINGNVVDGTPVRTWFYRTGMFQPWIALQINAVSWN